MSRFGASGLRARLMVFVLLAVAPLFVMTVYSAVEQRRLAATAIQQNIIGFTRVIAQAEEAALSDAIQMAGRIEPTAPVQTLDPTWCTGVLRSILADHTRLVAIGTVRPDGEIFCRAERNEGIISSAEFGEAFEEARRSGAFGMSRRVLAAAQNLPVLVWAPPVKAPDSVGVFLVLGLEWLGQLGVQADLPAGATVTLLLEGGDVALRYPDSEGWMGSRYPVPEVLQRISESSSRAFSYSGVGGSYMFAATPVSLPGGEAFGTVMVRLPVSVAYVGANRILRQNLIWLSILTLMALSVAQWTAEVWVIRPVNALVRVARRLQAGDRTARARLSDVQSEMGQLSRAFDDMADTLQAQHLELEEQHRAALEAAESKHRQALLFDTVLDAVIMTDLQWRITEWNVAAERLFGYTREEVLGREPDFLDPSPSDEGYRRVHAEMNGAERWTGRSPFLTKDGRVGVSENVVVRVRDAEGRPTGNIGVSRDITERERAEEALRESEERFRSLVETANDIIYRTDMEGYFTYVNPVAVQIMGYPSEKLVGMRYLELIREDAREAAAEFYREQMIHAVPTTYYEFPTIAADGREVWIGQNVRLLREGGRIVGAQAVARDITRQREVERMKDEFLSVVSHELRTPLTAIRGSLGLIASGKMGQLEERGTRMLEIAAQNTDRLVRLINDLLDIEKIESGKATMEMAEVNMGEAMRRASEGIAPIAEKAGVHIAVQPLEAVVDADYDRIEQVLTNLLSNAVKFSVEGGTVWLGGERREFDILLWVRDEGRGIPADKVNLIFERFQQVDSSDSRQKGGTGLGLPIARSIVQQHRGKLWVESRLGEGSTFFLTLPLRSQSPAGEPENDRPLVLLVDDDPDVGAYVRTLLQSGGYEVMVLNSGEGVVDTARRRAPAAILLDLGMPGMSGADVVVALRAERETKDVPIVVLSGSGGDPRLNNSEIVGWVQKPIDETKLLEAIQHASGRGQGCQVLIVEDDEDVGRVISEMMAERGIRTCIAMSGREAIELSNKLSYDLLLLDPGLPEIDGFGIIKWLRRIARYQSLPVIVYSARDFSETERASLRLGYTEFLVKTKTPIDELGRRIYNLLEKSNQSTAASAT